MTEQNLQTQHIEKEMFEFTQAHEVLHDKKLETKPVGYMRDAWRRFKKNKGSVVAACIILALILFAIFVPVFSGYGMSFADTTYQNMRPRNGLFASLGFWDGSYTKEANERGYEATLAIGVGAVNGGFDFSPDGGMGTEHAAVLKVKKTVNPLGEALYSLKVDSYQEVGFKYLLVTEEQIAEIRQMEQKIGKQIMYPMVDTSQLSDDTDKSNANKWYRMNSRRYAIDENGEEIRKTGGDFVPLYMKNEDGTYKYEVRRDKNMREIRVLYYNYFIGMHGKEPSFLFGTNNYGRDILVRLAGGVRTSLILAFSVSIINLIIGAIYGSVAGYYGGAVDLIMERITDILSGIPFMIVATLFQLHLVLTGKVSSLVALLFAFVLTGWIGTAATVRTQFYRFKGQEYVLAARTLGAKDPRLIFKHIFPNTLGTLITSSVLVIPSVIFDESMLSYLGIIDLGSDTFSSIGSMLADGQGYLSTYPHVILFPAIVISLLMICFNLFGNGLRDAFNPNLRGAED